MNPKQPYLVGISGGRDSVVLLDLLLSAGFQKLTLCHLNHQLRGRTSDRDADFVRKLAASHQLPFLSARANVKTFARENQISIETAARELRYAFFAECAKRTRCPRLVLAHHADDQTETVLFNFLRGSGAAGLAGMKPCTVRGQLQILRPLLSVSAEALRAYAAEAGIKWREDASNQSLEFTRNRLRHQILPLLDTALGRNYRPALCRAAEIFSAEEDWMSSLVPLPEKNLTCAQVRAFPLALRRRFIRRWLQLHQISDPGFEEVERVLSLLGIPLGPAKINLPGNRHARRRAGILFIE